MGDVWESDGVVVETWESSTEPGVTFTTVIREGDIVTGGSGVDLSDAAPQDLGTAASGVSDEASRADHVHDMPTAADIAVDASGFDGNLTTSDDTVQEIAQKLDDLVIPAAGIADPGGSNDDFLQRKSGAWTNRTVAQVKTDLGVVSGVPVVSSAKVVAAGAYGTPLYEVVNTAGAVAVPPGDMVAIVSQGAPTDLTKVGYEVTATSATSGQVCQLGCFAINADGSLGALLWQEDLPASTVEGVMRTLSTTRAVPALRGWVVLNPNGNAGAVTFRGWLPKPSHVGITSVYFSRFGYGLQASLTTLPSDLSSYLFSQTDYTSRWGHNNFTTMPALVGVTA